MRTMIAIPCMDTVPTAFLMSLLGLEKGSDCDVTLSVSSLIYDARNQLAQKAVDGNYDRILWLDSDMQFDRDLMTRLHAALDEGADMVSALFFKRKPPIAPVIYKAIWCTQEESGATMPHADLYHDYPRDQVFEIAACGFGGVMMKVELLKTVKEKFGLPFSPIMGFGEDLSFCVKARETGARLVCDSRIKMGHVGFTVFNEESYLQRRDAT